MTKEQAISGAIVTIIATLVGWLTNRASNKANMTNVATSSRVEMEKEAYERARRMDTTTIERQDAELLELEGKFEKLKERLDASAAKNEALEESLRRLTLDSYHLHQENTRVLAVNEQLLAENGRLRQVMEEITALREQVNSLQVGEDARVASTHPIPEVNVGGE